MLTLSSDLTAAQPAARRIPAISVTVEARRLGVPALANTQNLADTSGDDDCQLSLCNDPTQQLAPLAVRTNGTALDYQPDYPNTASWTNLDTVSAGQGFQLAWDPVAAVFALAYGDGLSVKFRTSADGTSWSSATTIVTEASNIGAVALAFDDAGDACLFYVIGTSTTLKRLRRSSGSWAGAGTTWSKTAGVANLTGLAAQWRSDYYLAVTGLEASHLRKYVDSTAQGDPRAGRTENDSRDRIGGAAPPRWRRARPSVLVTTGETTRAQPWLNVGARFSRNAVTASLWSGSRRAI